MFLWLQIQHMKPFHLYSCEGAKLCLMGAPILPTTSSSVTRTQWLCPSVALSTLPSAHMDSFLSPSQVKAAQIQALVRENQPPCVFLIPKPPWQGTLWFSLEKWHSDKVNGSPLASHQENSSKTRQPLTHLAHGKEHRRDQAFFFSYTSRYQLIPPLQGKHCAKKGRLGQKSCWSSLKPDMLLQMQVEFSLSKQ